MSLAVRRDWELKAVSMYSVLTTSHRLKAELHAYGVPALAGMASALFAAGNIPPVPS